jgi:hypothetical protein
MFLMDIGEEGPNHLLRLLAKVKTVLNPSHAGVNAVESHGLIPGRVMPAKPIKSCSLTGSTSFDSTEMVFSRQLGSMRAD